MRTIEEFKQDRDQWNREMANKLRIRNMIGWTVALVVLAGLAIAGFAYYRSYQAQHANDKPAASTTQTPTD